jgi:hypothetical protein
MSKDDDKKRKEQKPAELPAPEPEVDTVLIPEPSSGSQRGTRAITGTGGIAQLDAVWMSKQTTEDLISLLALLAQELKRRSVEKTRQVEPEQMPADEQFPATPDLESHDVVKLPTRTSKPPERVEAIRWRIALVSSDAGSQPILIDVEDDFTIGRSVEGQPVDLDLTPFNAEEKGISRQHAMMRPLPDRLLLVDLGSTNGTFCNAERAHLGRPLEVRDNDTVAFGALRFQIRVISRPGKSA